MKNLGDNPMPTLLERHWPKLALLLTVSLLAGLFFVPALAQGFAMPLIALMLGMGLLLLALRHWRAYRAGKLSRPSWRVMFSSKPPACYWSLSWPGSRAGLWRGLFRKITDGCWDCSPRCWSARRRALRYGFATQDKSGCPQDAGAVG
jgi:hypothetical protein